jgi:hypothetical protein
VGQAGQPVDTEDGAALRDFLRAGRPRGVDARLRFGQHLVNRLDSGVEVGPDLARWPYFSYCALRYRYGLVVMG